MTKLSPRLRKILLTAHVLASVGWFGAVGVFLALAISGLTGEGEQLVRAAYGAMGLIGWSVIVPLSLAALLTGVVLSAGTSWGFFRHYWVIIKLGITVVATVVLMVHMQPIGALADVAATKGVSGGVLIDLRTEVVVQASAALVVLIVATALSVYKPPGRTRLGWRVQQEQRMPPR
ncbi:hypothetical protein GCM10027052_25190 [Parafrigoribacterium mesophilum]|uniref:DUF2269 domain-containing protein n=1 Tax=Parafrigoribacterium mesophilum TaxID=433646 RepID=UPI0031FC18C2